MLLFATKRKASKPEVKQINILLKHSVVVQTVFLGYTIIANVPHSYLNQGRINQGALGSRAPGPLTLNPPPKKKKKKKKRSCFENDESKFGRITTSIIASESKFFYFFFLPDRRRPFCNHCSKTFCSRPFISVIVVYGKSKSRECTS